MMAGIGREWRIPPKFEDCGFHGRNSRTYYNKRVRIWNRTGGYCTYCDHPLTFVDAKAFHMVHKTPRSRGGTNDDSNLVPACEPCNRSKGNMTHDEFIEKRETRNYGTD